MTEFFKEKIALRDKEGVIKLHFIIKNYEKQFNLSDAHLSTLVELYKTGYNEKFFENCISKEYFRSEQTVRNAISKMTTLGILKYKRRGERDFSSDFLPNIKNDKVIIQYLVGNL